MVAREPGAIARLRRILSGFRRAASSAMRHTQGDRVGCGWLICAPRFPTCACAQSANFASGSCCPGKATDPSAVPTKGTEPKLLTLSAQLAGCGAGARPINTVRLCGGLGHALGARGPGLLRPRDVRRSCWCCCCRPVQRQAGRIKCVCGRLACVEQQRSKWTGNVRRSVDL